jgi:hypothetical protein
MEDIMRSILTLFACMLSIFTLQSNSLFANSGQSLDGKIQFNADLQLRGCGCQGGGKKTPNTPLPANDDLKIM